MSSRKQYSAITVQQSAAMRGPAASLVLPFIFLTVALLGGLRVSAEDHAFVFVPPPLITLVLAVLLMLLLVRGGLIELRSWIAPEPDTTREPNARLDSAHALFRLRAGV